MKKHKIVFQINLVTRDKHAEKAAKKAILKAHVLLKHHFRNMRFRVYEKLEKVS